METAPRISVVICHHTQRLVTRCLDSVWLSRGVEAHVIVITSDPTYVEDRVTLYFLEDGPAAKRNLGAKVSTTPYVIYLDDDCEIAPHCLYELWRWMEDHPQCGMAYAKILKMDRRGVFDDAGSWLTWTGFLFARAGNDQEDRGQFDTPTRCLSSKSATCIVRRTAWMQIGGFDRDYFILGEESDFSFRLWWQGWENWYVPTARSWHAFGTPLKPPAEYYTLTRIHRLGSRNYCKFLTTNLPWSKLWWMLPCHVSIWVFSAVGYGCIGHWKRAYAVLAGLWDWSQGWRGDWRKRQRVFATRQQDSTTFWSLITASPPWAYYRDRLHRYLFRGLHG